MNYLQLTNDFITESGIGDKLGSVVNQSDEYAQAALWVSDAWVEIQRNRFWDFRWAEGTFATVAGQSDYALSAIGRVAGDDFDLTTFFLGAPGAIGTQRLTPIRFKKVRELRAFAQLQGTQPQFIAKLPNGTLRIYPEPKEVKPVHYEYFKAPVVLSDDLDTPTLEPQFHKAIVWKALEQYAREQGREWDGLYQAAIRNFNAIYEQMLDQETGEVFIAPSPLSNR